jgi:FixJ family two-component response regulator
MREALEGLLRSAGLEVEVLASASRITSAPTLRAPLCLVLDGRLPRRSGLDFQRELSAANIHVPIIFITGHGAVPMLVQAMKGGAIEFPSRSAIRTCLMRSSLALRDRAWLENEKAIAALRARFDMLTTREREVMAEIMKGRPNKQIAGDIGVSAITVKVHRSQVMSVGASRQRPRRPGRRRPLPSRNHRLLC